MSKPGRNDPCPCGSGKKFKKCCLGVHVTPAQETHDRDAPTEIASAQPVVFFDDIDLLSNRAVDLINEGHLDEAEGVCQRLFKEFPDLPDGFVRTAAIHEARGQRTEAAECYRRAADLQMKADPEYGHELAAHYRARASELDAEGGVQPPSPTDS